MLQRTDQPERDPTAERLRALIAERGLQAGDRLPAERELIQILRVGRAPLRRALERLELEGRIWRHVGKGTFIAKAADPMETGADLFLNIGAQLTPLRMMRARLCIEPAIAREAAVNASHQAVSRISAAIERSRAAGSWAEYERQDGQVHRAVAEAADNALLLALFDGLNRVSRNVAVGAVTRKSTRPPRSHSSFAEHETIIAAIAAHDPDEAFHSMRRHLQSVAARLFGDA